MEGGGIELFSKPPTKRKRNQQAKQQVPPEATEDAAQRRSSNEASTSAPSSATFKELGLTDWLCSVCRSLGMVRPTPVQEACIPAVLAGRDVIGLASTGSGKTAAFALPILMQLAKDPYGVFALVLTPTRCAQPPHAPCNKHPTMHKTKFHTAQGAGHPDIRAV